MIAAYIAVTVVAATVYAYAAYLNFVGHESVIAIAEETRVPQSWMIPLGTLLASGSLGLLVGLAVPLLGTAAAVGLVLYFLGALGAHLRAHYYEFGNWAIFFSLAVATLAVGLAYHGPS
jgi:DoxX-like family